MLAFAGQKRCMPAYIYMHSSYSSQASPLATALAVARTSTSRERPFSPGLFGILFSCCALLPPLISLHFIMWTYDRTHTFASLSKAYAYRASLQSIRFV